jgi:hypothetical protein
MPAQMPLQKITGCDFSYHSIHSDKEEEMTLTATYSPEDNKLRLYSTFRLDEETYRRVKAAGFSWAPKQDLFVAPMWTPLREDLLLELCGEIGDEDTGLVDRAEQRADRFEGYSERRALDADRAHRAVSAITEHIPFGQPILVGHHSERRARKDAERIENGMRHAVKMWETSEYWEQRAQGALRNAKYKERPDVRHRRIKRIESDRRRFERSLQGGEKFVKLWRTDGLDMKHALALAGRSTLHRTFPLADYPRNPPANQYEGDMSIWSALEGGVVTVEQARDLCVPAYERGITWNRRWIAHYDNRLLYERAMLGEQGGLMADRFEIEPGGQVKVRGEWLPVVRVTRKDGVTVSVTTTCRYVRVRGIEEVQDYRAPSAEDAARMKAAVKLPPMCNYPGDGFHHMTKAEWDSTCKDYKGSRELGQGARRPGGYRPDVRGAVDGAAEYGRHRVRSVVRTGGLVAVYLTDAKRIDPPAAPAMDQAA